MWVVPDLRFDRKSTLLHLARLDQEELRKSVYSGFFKNTPTEPKWDPRNPV